jgi:hypothetical protein
MTTASTNNDGAGIRSDGLIHAKRADVVATFNRKTSDGTVVQIAKDNTVVGTIAANGGSIIVGSGNTGLYFDDGSDRLIPVDPATASGRDNAVDLGGASERFKDLYLSGGIEFGNSSGNPNNTIGNNKLDEYEEGTFSPGILNGWGILNPTYSTNAGVYTRIGNIVHVAFRITLSGGSSNTNGLRVVNLPFTVGATTNVGTNLSGWFSTASGNVENVFLGLEANDAQPLFYYKVNNGTSTFLGTDAGTSASLTFSGTYQVA